MPILAKSELVLPEKRFDKLRINKIEINIAYEGTEIKEISGHTVLVPYNDAGEISAPNAFVIPFINIAGKTQNPDSNYAKAMYYMMAAIAEEYNIQQENSNE